MFPEDSKILIVDDSSFARTMLKNCLKELKYWKLLEAENAKRAQELLREEEQLRDPVHLILTDVQMPEMTGLQLLGWVRAEPAWADVPVIVLTSSQTKGDIIEAGRLGVSHFLIKPFNTVTLGERMASAWEKHGRSYFEARQ
jgi:two-component system chemotaxis response regulator CheY